MATKNEENVLMVQQSVMDGTMKDMKSFCQWNRMNRFAKGSKPEVLQKYEAARTEGDRDKAAQALASVPVFDLWTISLTGHPSLKDKSRDLPIISTSEDHEIKIDDLATYARTGKLLGQSPDSESFLLPMSFEPGIDIEKFKDENSLSGAKKAAACGYAGKLTSIPSCMDSLDQILQYAKPSRGNRGGTTAMPSFMEIIPNKNYAAGLKTAVLKMHKKFKSRVSSGDLFSDIQSSFIETGDSKAQATDKTWEVMAALAATGPNMYGRVWDKGAETFNPNAASLIAIAAMIPHLDTDAMQSSPPHNYSLPPGIEFPCDSGKNYHFWMSAYLSRMLVKNGKPPEVATTAAYISELGYQTQSESAMRNPSTASSWQRFGDTEVGVQIDLNLAAAGAHYGADSNASAAHYNITDNFRKSVSTMGTSSSHTDNTWTSLLGGDKIQWLDNYRPMSTLKSYDR